MSKHILLGICGSIAAYKSPDIVRGLVKKGFRVTCILTRSAQKFVSKFALENVSEEICYTDDDFWNENNLHIKLARQVDFLLLAPATINSLSKLSSNLADNLLLNCCVSFKKNIICAPSMHTEMYEKAYVDNVFKTLKKKGVKFLGPISGELLSGDVGLGRMLEPKSIADSVEFLSHGTLNLTNKKILVVSGGTKENIDPVRQITNASSGIMGQALAATAAANNANVSLLSTTTCDNFGYKKLLTVPTYKELKQAVLDECRHVDYVIMAAAISDYIPKYNDKKIKRSQDNLMLELFPTEDILRLITQTYPNKTTIGFCLQDDINDHSIPIKKVKDKSCDFIISNTTNNLGNYIKTYSLFQKQQFKKKLENISVAKAAYEIMSLITN